MGTVFINYRHEDVEWKDTVMTHLKVLEKQGKLNLWNDLCDYPLEAARLCHDQGDETGAAEHDRHEEELIEKNKYFRRKKESKGNNGKRWIITEWSVHHE